MKQAPRTLLSMQALVGFGTAHPHLSSLLSVCCFDTGGPCRKFTPDLVAFYKKINKRRRNDFEIVWISRYVTTYYASLPSMQDRPLLTLSSHCRCRAVESHWEFFAHMGWMSIPPEEAMGKRGPALSDRFKVKGIPTLVLLDSDGHVITRDGRNKIPQDKAGIGFPWRNPITTLYLSLVPKSVRTLAKRQLSNVGRRLQAKLGHSLGAMRSKKSAGQTSKATAAAAA
jgi:nucleoredoxin